MHRKILLLFTVFIPFLCEAQAWDQQATTQKARELTDTYKRKMDALLVEMGTMAFEAPDYMKDSVDVVTWIKNNRPSVYRENREFLEAFARDYMGVTSKETAPRQILDWWYGVWDRIQMWAERTANRLVGAWRNG